MANSDEEKPVTQIPKIEAVVAGHICLDIIPSFYPAADKEGKTSARLEEMLTPGKLINVGPATISTGGAVSNTGLALHRLGVPVRLVSKVGADQLGQLVLQHLADTDPRLTEGIVVTPGEASSYTLVISPPGVDRIFLHCPGANHTFCAADVQEAHLAGARLFHFGYPPLMRRFYQNNGQQMRELFQKARQHGLVASLDMARPDPDSEAGQVDWKAFLAEVLPEVDVFEPSADEILYMLDRAQFERMQAETPAGQNWLSGRDAALLAEVSDRLMAYGTPIIFLKLGEQGSYLRTTTDPKRLEPICQKMGLSLQDWLGRECLAPIFKAKVVTTNGAGDCTIAGFLTGLLKGLLPEEVITGAVATGACNVEAADATSGVPHWSRVQERIHAGWERQPVDMLMKNWQWNQKTGVWYGPHDRQSK